MKFFSFYAKEEKCFMYLLKWLMLFNVISSSVLRFENQFVVKMFISFKVDAGT